MLTTTPSLWFDNDLEEAMRFYAGIFGELVHRSGLVPRVVR